MGVKVFENGIVLLEDVGVVVSYCSIFCYQVLIGDFIFVIIDMLNGGQVCIMEWGVNNDLLDMCE